MGGVGVILQISGTGYTAHKQSQTTSYGEMKILKEQGVLQKKLKFERTKDE